MAEVWLITGAAGFIGSNVAAHLLAQGHQVVGLDNLSSGDIHNVVAFSDLPSWHWVLGDITDPILAQVFSDYPITRVLHLAALVSVQECEKFPEKAREINEKGFQRVLDLAIAHGVKQVIYASSSAVYGAAEVMPIPETTPLNPISLYGETKVNNERAAALACTHADLSCTGFRFFNLFGPHQGVHSGYAAVIPRWIHAIRANQSGIIYGNGTATRDFCPIQNVLVAIDRAVELTLPGHAVFNIGNGVTTTLNQLYALLCDILGAHPEPLYLPWQAGDIVHSCADISLARSLLAYSPEVSLEEGLITMTRTPSSRLL
jgi:UDP-N-acetylglucosamine 4-epimerase